MANLKRKISNLKTSSRKISSRKSRTNSRLLDLKNIDLEEQKSKKSTKKSNSKTKSISKKKEVKKANAPLKKKEVKKAKTPAKKKSKIKKSDFVKNYSCVWRMETFENELTNEKYRKRVWIVIGDGDKKYRKFDSQAEAISYFRSLKKRAEMKVQSISSKRFVRIVYTLFDMQEKGININEIKKNKNKTEPKVNKIINDDIDFEDEYSKFDTVEFDNLNDEAEIDAALAKSIEYSVYIEDTNTNYIDTFESSIDKYDDEEETIEVPQKDFSTELVMVNEESNDEEENPKTFYLRDQDYEIDKTYTIEEEPLKITSPTEVYSFTKDINYVNPLENKQENNNDIVLNEAFVVNNFKNEKVEEEPSRYEIPTPTEELSPIIEPTPIEEPLKIEESSQPSLTELYAITKDMNLETKPSSSSVNMDVESVTVYEKPQQNLFEQEEIVAQEENILKSPKQDTTTILKRTHDNKTTAKNVGKIIVITVGVVIIVAILAFIAFVIYDLFFKGK